jgi:hypothetical protein
MLENLLSLAFCLFVCLFLGSRNPWNGVWVHKIVSDAKKANHFCVCVSVCIHTHKSIFIYGSADLKITLKSADR